jgi:HPt (histidine-containing phosphotransfer) domain-containing protein
MGNLADVRRMFLSEFGTGLGPVRAAYRHAMMDRAQLADATRAAQAYTHRMAGVAEMVGFPLVGEIAALCEGLCKLKAPPEGVDVPALVQSALDTLDRFFQTQARVEAEDAAPSKDAAPAETGSKRTPRRHS